MVKSNKSLTPPNVGKEVNNWNSHMLLMGIKMVQPLWKKCLVISEK